MLLGLVSFRTMPITRFPNIDIPIVQVLITQSGAAPSELETQVTKKVEDAVAGLNGVWHITSTSHRRLVRRPSSSSVGSSRHRPRAQRREGRRSPRSAPTCRAPSTSRSSAASTSRACRSSPTRASAPGMTAEQLSWFVDDMVARELQSVKGVGEVKRFGGVDREIRVSLDPDKLLALGVTAGDVNEQVRADQRRSSAAAAARSAGQEQAIRTLAGAQPVADLAAPADRAAGRPQGAARRTRRPSPTPPRSRAPSRGVRRQPIVAFAITRAKGASDVDGRRRRRRRRLAELAGRASRGDASPRSTPRSTTSSATTTRRWRR